MFKSKAFLVLTAISFCCSPGRAESTSDSEYLLSASVGKIFYETAYELANKSDMNPAETEQAIILLTAAMELDRNADYVNPVLIELTCKYSARDHSKLVYQLLGDYANKYGGTDLEPVRAAIRYLLGHLNSREEREQFLINMLKNLGGNYPVLDSDLSTSLGLLIAETPDVNSAQHYLLQAYYNNKYNKLAFSKLAELMPGQLAPGVYLEQLRLAVAENPTDLEAVLVFAQYAEQLQLYETAKGVYEYCVELYRYKNPTKPLPAYIYLPWAISCYNTQRNRHKCLQIVEIMQEDGQFDMLLEAIAGKAALKTGNPDIAKNILQKAEEKAHSSFAKSRQNLGTRTVDQEQLAWFYCFALPDANKALDWANKAYSVEPNSPTTAALLAYALVINDQAEWAELLTSNYERNQIAYLATAQIQLTKGQKDTAIQSLKSAINRDPGSLAAERAKEILTEQGGQYIPPVDPTTTLALLKKTFGELVVPTFIRPEKMISVHLNLRGSQFTYGSELDGTVAIKNTYSQPLIISDYGLFKGHIKIDAKISGDINKEIPGLVSIKIAPGSPIKPERSIAVPVRLLTGELRQTLLTYPQASLNIEFTVHLDPIVIADGKLSERLHGLKPAKALVKRPGIQLTGKYLQNRLGSLTKGQQGQKIKTTQLFSGLIREQNAIAGSKPLYKMMSADWMPALLKSALIHNLKREDWVVKVHTMAGLLSLPLDFELTSAVAENLNDTHWPTRLMALCLLAKHQEGDFSKVLEWTANYDSSKFVRDMAIVLGAISSKSDEPVNASLSGNP
jgi:tetratricopeptide (TPR) repeat protein